MIDLKTLLGGSWVRVSSSGLISEWHSGCNVGSDLLVLDFDLFHLLIDLPSFAQGLCLVAIHSVAWHRMQC